MLSDFRQTDVATSVTQPSGLNLKVNYVPSSYESHNVTGFPLTVVKSVATAAGAPKAATAYAYAGGAYSKAAREFRGFHHVAISHPQDDDGRGLLEEINYHQGDGLTPGQDTVLHSSGLTSGRPYMHALRDSNRQALSASLLEYQAATPEPSAPDWSVPQLVARRVTFAGDNMSPQRSIAYAYDAAGNLTHTTDSDLSSAHGLTVQTHIKYSNDFRKHALAYPVSFELTDNLHGRLRYETYAYDESTCAGTPRGAEWQQTSIKRWIDDGHTVEQHFGHSPTGAVVCREDENASKTAVQYDSEEEYVLAVTDEMHHTVRWAYFNVAEIHPDQPVGLLRSFTDVSGDATHYEYDLFGRPTRVTGPDQSSTTYQYNDFGDPTKQNVVERRPSGIETRQYFDAYGQPYATLETASQGHNRAIRYSYNAAGNVAAVSEPEVLSSAVVEVPKLKTAYSARYDEIGRITAVTSSTERTWSTCYKGLVTATIDPNGHGYRATFDVFGNIIRVEQFDSRFSTCVDIMAAGAAFASTSYEYDGATQLRSVAVNGSIASSFNYDGGGHLTAITSQDRGNSVFEYDRAGRLQRTVDSAGNTLEYVRDSIGRITSVSGHTEGSTSQPLHEYSYDSGPHGVGRLASLVQPGLELSYQYDAAGRVVTETLRNDGTELTLARSYDVLGRIKTLTYPDGFELQYDYDGTSLTSVEAPGLYVKASAFTSNGRASTLSFGNEVIEDREYGRGEQRTDIGRGPCASTPSVMLCSSTLATRGAPPIRRTYAYDEALNLSAIDDSVLGHTTFSYDPLDRVTTEAVAPPGGASPQLINYGYDDRGRRTVVSGQGAYHYDDTPTARPSYPSSVGSAPLKSDKIGNRVAFAGSEFRFDLMGRLAEVSVESGDSSTSFFKWPSKIRIAYDYDGNGTMRGRSSSGSSWLGIPFERSSLVTMPPYTACSKVPFWRRPSVLVSALECTNRIYAGGNLVATARTRFDRSSASSTRTIEYYHVDGLDNVRAISRSDGVVVDVPTMSAFGVSSRPSPGRYYAGHWWDDDAKLYDFGARFYDPFTGQFISADSPAMIATGITNSYNYAWNNPLRWRDPDGHQPISGNISTGTSSGGGWSLGAGGIKVDINPGAFRGSGFSGMGSLFSAGIATHDFGLGFGSGLKLGSLGNSAASGNGASIGAQSIANDAIQVDYTPEIALTAFAATLGVLARGVTSLATLSAEIGIGGGVAGSAAAVGGTFGKLGTLVSNPGIAIRGFAGSSTPGHAINQVISRGVTPTMLKNTVSNAAAVLQQSGGRYLFLGKDAAVVMTAEGQVVTAWTASQFDAAVIQVLKAVGSAP